MTIPYIREYALWYARRWAFRRNPRYYDFSSSGGDCTNFVSQCIYAGAGVMNYTKDFGWYYISPSDRAPAWTGVQYLYNFLTTNEGAGPFGTEAPVEAAYPADVIQLSFDGEVYSHSLLVIQPADGPEGITVAAHSDDAFNRPLYTYNYEMARLIHIEGVRRNI